MTVTKTDAIQALRWAKTVARCEVLDSMKPGRRRREFTRRAERYDEVLTFLLEQFHAAPDQTVVNVRLSDDGRAAQTPPVGAE